ncbi:hypothetical protein N7509_001493 [Penicillium cosmopolitanum]|uniref:Uncharacterized protein n=1 Tax=Penicillium cosmopolitanum TaxID=1131564 RepID=A0A9X0BCI7_9EURO|nr:uncharacterized protein N7509_001493 [Penicillium cosmopolitanum]KAJ5407610.1 hypothetical protein N7509_001493 [Penicillium cosmopolitanum]
MEPATEFPLFGQCVMEIPTAEERKAADKYLLLLEAFQTSLETRTPTEWDFAPDFAEMAQRDLAAWEQLGVQRLPQFVQPSGDIKSPLALHLLNPTFHVADAQSIVTDDPTNATINDSESILKRFVIHAYHPSFFFRSSRLKKSGPSFDDAYRKPQQLMISMAVQLAGLSQRINIKPHLLGDRHRSKADIQLTTDQDLAKKENLLAALNAFKVAFPAKFKRWELKASCNQSAKNALLDLERSLSEPPVPMQTHRTGPLSVEEQTLRINAREESLHALAESFQSLKEDILSPFDPEIIMEDSQHSDDYVSSDAFDFDSIPAALRTWLALQDGLKIQGQPLNSRESLELVFSLLHRSPDPHIKQIPAGFLASSVAISYVRKMMQPQSQSKKDKFIPAEPGQVHADVKSPMKLQGGQSTHPPRFLIPRIRCQCDGKDHYFEPVDKTIKTISYRELEKIWNGFAKVGCNLADYPKIADYIFETKSTVSYKVRHKLLIKEKKARAEPGKTI